MKIGQEPDVILTKKLGFSLAEDLFFFGDHLNLDKKKPTKSKRIFFVLRSSKFGQKNRLNLSKDRSKFGSRSFDVVSSLQNSPPPLQIPGYARVSTGTYSFDQKIHCFRSFSVDTCQQESPE